MSLPDVKKLLTVLNRIPLITNKNNYLLMFMIIALASRPEMKIRTLKPLQAVC